MDLKQELYRRNDNIQFIQIDFHFQFCNFSLPFSEPFVIQSSVVLMVGVNLLYIIQCCMCLVPVFF